MKLLIAEDNTALQKTMEMMMKAWNFDFDITSDGQEAVNQAKRNKGAYDLCIMDVEMPIMDGCEATHYPPRLELLPHHGLFRQSQLPRRMLSIRR